MRTGSVSGRPGGPSGGFISNLLRIHRTVRVDSDKTKNINLVSLLLLMNGLPITTGEIGHPMYRRRKFNWASPFIVNEPGLGSVIGIGAAIIALVLLFLFALVLGGQFANLATLFPASNSTRITTNIANGVVTGANFLTLIYLGAAVGVVIVVFALAIRAMKGMAGKGD